jgi:hypothetical protein
MVMAIPTTLTLMMETRSKKMMMRMSKIAKMMVRLRKARTKMRMNKHNQVLTIRSRWLMSLMPSMLVVSITKLSFGDLSR